MRYRSWIRLFSSADNTIAPIRRNQVQGHDALHLLRKVRIARQSEGLHTMRLQPAGSPDLVNGRSRKSRRPAHRAQAPVGGVRRSPVKGHVNQPGHPVRGDAARATRSRSMVEGGHATLKKTLPPLARRMSRRPPGIPGSRRSAGHAPPSGRSGPELPGFGEVEPLRARSPPGQNPDVRAFVIGLGRIVGFQPSKRQPVPGVHKLWVGNRTLKLVCRGVQLARNSTPAVTDSCVGK